jgi:hypothetical protein
MQILLIVTHLLFFINPKQHFPRSSSNNYPLLFYRLTKFNTIAALLLFYGKRAKIPSDTRMSYFETIYVPQHMTFSDAQASVKQQPSPFIHHHLSLVPTITYHYKSVNTHNTHTTRTLILISYHQYVRIRTTLLFFGHLLADWFLPLLFVDDGRLSLRSAPLRPRSISPARKRSSFKSREW